MFFAGIHLRRWWLALVSLLVQAQVPHGEIVGLIQDASGSRLARVQILVVNQETYSERRFLSLADGNYICPALNAGRYRIRVEVPGFAPLEREAEVATGAATRVDFEMRIAPQTDVVEVHSVPFLQEGSAAVTTVITREQIEDLPLNGRNFLQLAALDAGVTTTAGATGQFNRQFDVSVLGGNSLHTSITVDGGSIWDQTTGGTGLNLSQEAVREFQISSANFDLSTGIASYGAISVVTRNGGNALHGSAYLYFRDHHLAAYPGLARNALDSDPYFARKQPGGWISGPLRKNRLFYFVNVERNLQNSVFLIQPNSPLLGSFAEVAPSVYRGTQINARFDASLPGHTNLVVRYTHDGNRSTGPSTPAPVSPSNWVQNSNWSDQSYLGITTELTPSLIHDFRFSYWYWNNRLAAAPRADCTALCVGYGLPEINVLGTNFVVGSSHDAPQGRDNRRWTFNDSLTWVHGGHRVRLGAELAHQNGAGFWSLSDPASITVYSPDLLSQLGLLPAYGLAGGLHTVNDLLKLPIYSFSAGFGDPAQPQPYNQDTARKNNRVHAFAQDTWQVRPGLTLNYGLAWSYEDNLLNFDLPKPAFLAPIFGAGGLGAGNQNYKNFSPSLGFAWRAGSDGRTVIRAGSGIYYDTQLLWQRLEERSYLGPFPNGRVVVDGAAIPNPVPGIPGAPLGSPIRYTNAPTGFTAGLLVQLLPAIRDALEPMFGQSSNQLNLRTIDVVKTASHLMPENFPTAYGEHFSAGIQRQLSNNLSVSADFVFRQYVHTLFDDVMAPDYNHFDAAQGPAIRKCVGAEGSNPAALCSNGPITVWTPGGRGHYKGLLLSAKRMGKSYQFTASYAFSSEVGFSAAQGLENLNDWFANYGPVGARHIVNLAGMIRLPFGLDLSFLSTIQSRPPVMPYIDQVDLSGSGATYSFLPGADFNCFNRGCGSADLSRLVANFNSTLAGKLTSRGQTIPTLMLPSSYNLGQGISSQDFRLSKVFPLVDRVQMKVFAEMFNTLNIGNKSGYNFNLNSQGFGQPTQRLGQVFGSGGPRAAQLGIRVSF